MSISYLLYTAILIAIFYCLYHLLLRKETFFQLNRYILIAGIFLSFVIPTIHTPVKIKVAETTIEAKPMTISELSVIGTVLEVSETSKAFGGHPKPNSVTLQTKNKTSNIKIFTLLYLIGVAVFLINLLIQLFKITITVFKYKKKQAIITLPYQSSPYSFFTYIFIGENNYSPDALSEIIEHEKIHAQQKHSIDIILAELLIITQWFNPFAWLYRKAIEKNLEYIVDDKMLSLVDSKKDYQYNLLNLAVKNFPLSVINNYNQSLIKTRIKMMNTKKSSLKQSWKYLLLIPTIALTIFIFNPSSLNGLSITQDKTEEVMVVINANASSSDLERVREQVESFGLNLTFRNLTWDENNKLKSHESSLSGNGHSVGNIVAYSDINRYAPSVMYVVEAGSGGLVFEGALSPDLLATCFKHFSEKESEEIKANIKVISSFTKDILSYTEFIHSNEFHVQKQEFTKELTWQKQFFGDIENLTSSFNYVIDGKKTSIKDIKQLFTLRDIRDVAVEEQDSGLNTLHIYSVPYKGFIAEAMSSSCKGAYSSFNKFISDYNSIINKKVNENKNVDVIYYYRGIGKEDVLETIDSTKVRCFSIEEGNNFDQLGNHLGRELRVNFK